MLLLVGLGALLVRVWHLPDTWLDADESIYYRMTFEDTDVFASMLDGGAASAVYAYILRGISTLTTDLFLLRMISVSAGVLSVVGVYFLTISIVGPTASTAARRIAGLFSVFVMASSPAAIVVSRALLPHALQTLAVLVALAGLVRWSTNLGVKWLALYATAMTAAVFLHPSSLILLGSSTIAAVFIVGRERPKGALAAWGFAVAPLAAAVYVLGSAPVRGLAQRLLETSAAQPTNHPDAWIGSAGELLGYLVGAPANMALCVLLPAGLWACARREQPLPVVLFFGTFAAAVALSTIGLFPFGASPHAFYSLALAAPFAGVGFEALLHIDLVAFRWIFATPLAAAVVLISASVPAALEGDWPGSRPTTSLREAGSVRDFLQSETLEDDLLLTDRATRSLLCALFRAHYEGAGALDDTLETCQIAGRRFLVAHASDRLLGLREERGLAGHLEQVLDAWPRDGREDDSSPPRRVWMVQGQGLTLPFQLPRRRDGRALTRLAAGGSTLAVFSVDVAAYREYLGGFE